jgi:hypothetical protein
MTCSVRPVPHPRGMRDIKMLIEGTSVLALEGLRAGTSRRRVPLKVVEEDIYGKLARRRRKAQMAARRALGVHDDVRGPAD